MYAKDLNGYDVIDPSTIEIYVTDINDNKPIFEQDSYVGQVAEHSPPGKALSILSVEPFGQRRVERTAWTGPRGHGSVCHDNADRYKIKYR